MRSTFAEKPEGVKTAKKAAGPAPYPLAPTGPSGALAGLPRFLQTRLTINQPGDPFEQEADRIADHVVRMPPQSAVAAPAEDFAPPEIEDVLHAPGQPLDARARAFAEPLFGQDLSWVRIHTDSQGAESARAIGAGAYAAGTHIAFGNGEFAPETPQGRRLLAHEITHVLQQTHTSTASALSPALRADKIQVMPFRRTSNPAELIAEYTEEGDEWYNREPDKLGSYLFELAAESTANYAFVHDVVYGLGTPAERGSAVRGFRLRSGSTGLDNIARTEPGRSLLNSLRNVYLVPKDVVPDVIPFDDAIGRGSGNTRAESVLDAAGRAAASGELLTAQPVDPLDIQNRMRLVRQMLESMRDRYGFDFEIERAIASLETSFEARFSAGDIDFEEDAKQIGTTQTIVESCDRSLNAFNRKLAGLRGRDDDFLGRFIGRIIDGLTGNDDPMEVQLVARVRGLWIEALKGAASPDGPKLLATAQGEAAALGEALNQFYLASTIYHSTGLAPIAASVGEMTGWAAWTIGQFNTQHAESDALSEARRKGENETEIKERAQKIQDRGEVIRISIEVIQLWDQALRAYEEIFAGSSIAGKPFLDAYGTFDASLDVLTRCQKVKNVALSGRLEALRAIADYNLKDPAIKALIQAAPALGPFGNYLPDLLGNMLLSAGIMKVASAAGAAAGALVSAGEDASTLNVLAQVGVESLVFTGVNRTLQSAIGNSPRISFLWDLALNFGLFGTLRFVGSKIRVMLTDRGFEIAGWAATQGAGFAAMWAFGVIRYRIEERGWPSLATLGNSTPEDLIMYALMMKPDTLPVTPGGSRRFERLERLHAKYGPRFERIEESRQHLEERVGEELKSEHAQDQAADQSLKDEGASLDKQLEELVNEINVDKEIDVDKLKTELSDPSLQTPEVAEELLAEKFDVAPETGLQRAGGEAEFTYEPGATQLLEEGLEANDVPFVEAANAAGLHTVTATPEGEPPAFFAERAPEPKPDAPKSGRKRRYVPPPAVRAKKAKSARKPRPGPKGKLFGPDGRLTPQGETQVRKGRKNPYKNATSDQLNAALQNPSVLERITREDLRRAIRRGDSNVSGRLLPSGRHKNIRDYAEELPHGNAEPVDLDQPATRFLDGSRNADLRQELVRRLATLRDMLGMKAAELSLEEIRANPWASAERLRQKAVVAQSEFMLVRASKDFVDLLGRPIGNVEPDILVWDEPSNELHVIDPTHTVNTAFSVFHGFKTMLNARILEGLTGIPADAMDYRSSRELTRLPIPPAEPEDSH